MIKLSKKLSLNAKKKKKWIPNEIQGEKKTSRKEKLNDAKKNFFDLIQNF